MSAASLRAAALGGAALVACLALGLFLGAEGVRPLAIAQGLLVLVATFWLAFGAALGLLGLLRPPPLPPEAPFRGRAVVLVPICDEDPGPTFARLRAIDAELRLAGLAPQVDIAILSDTRAEAVAVEEALAYQRLVAETNGADRLFYRRRTTRRGRKAGNIEDFVRRSGAAYDHAVILDADSLMTGATVARMLRRMEGDPRLGLLQTVPAILHARSRFGRMVAFASACHGPAFSRGLARLQGDTGPFWGHNAVVRVQAFAGSCGLPELSGPPPFGGHVLSHDYVEAALLARAGWTVRLDPDLPGSFEEGPETLLSFAKRDRRWCQGNLQHLRLVLAPGLRPWSRFVFAQGIFAYLLPVLWLALVVLALADGGTGAGAAPLALLVAGLILVPKALTALAARPRARGFGGHALLLASVAAELIQSSLVAPILLMFQARSVLQVLLGRDGGWPAQARGDGPLTLRAALRATWWIALWGAGLLAAAVLLAPALAPWLLPLALPMMLAAPLVAWTSRPPASNLFATPQDRLPAVARRAREGSALGPAPRHPARPARARASLHA